MFEPNQVGLRLTWQGSVVNGGTAPATGGTLTPPADHPRSGAVLCVTAGQVGFVDGGAEDGSFKFQVQGAREGADCSGADVPVELRGCYQ